MCRFQSSLWTSFFLGTACILAQAANELHVAPPPLGNDSNPGTLSRPFATIAHAELQTQAGDTVFLHEGVYRESVRFRRSGTAQAPICYQPYNVDQNPAEVRISAFTIIEPGVNGAGTWERHDGPIFKIQLTPEYGLGLGKSCVLINGEPQKIARWPDAITAFDFDWEGMASPLRANHDPSSAGPEPPHEGTFFTATYEDPALPVGALNSWRGARIDTSPGGGVFRDTGIVTQSTEDSVTFRYRPFPKPGAYAAKADPYFLWNHLNALDQEGEYFFDIEGVSGPAYTLYLIPPGDTSPDQTTVEIKSREYGFDMNWTSHIHLKQLNFIGGGIECPVSSSFIVMDDLHLRYCGSGLDALQTGRAAVWLKGDGHRLLNSQVEYSYGGGAITLGTNTEIANNVIRDCMLYGVASFDSSDIHAHHNTIFGNQGVNIHMYSPRGRFNYNHCYHAGKRVTDSASMNSNYNGDLQGMEIAYNWVHSNVARFNLTRTEENGAVRPVWGGGRGIRMDTSPSNVFIHHNIVWGISAPNLSLTLWALDPNQINYRNSMQRVYNNTIDGQIHIANRGSIGGIDIRNNICSEVREFGAEIDPHIVRNNLMTIGKFEPRWPGNTADNSLFKSATTGNFELHGGATAIDAGEHISGITTNFAGDAPDVGALEHNGSSNPHWSAGALLRPKDAEALRFSVLMKPNSDRYLVVSGMPEGRIPAREFTIRLGPAVLEDHRLIYSTETHHAEAYFKIEAEDLSGNIPVDFSLDGATFQSNGNAIDLQGSSLQIRNLNVAATTPSGGTPHTITGRGFGPDEWTIPLKMENTTGEDLNHAPVPVIFNSREHIERGRMNPDCSDLRILHWETGRELKYWIESGSNSEATLLWVKYGDDSPLVNRFSHLDESGYYLSFGEPGRESSSNPAIVYDYFPELLDEGLKVWVSANRLAETQQDGDPISSWDNIAYPNSLTQADPSATPTLKFNQLNQLPAANFNGSDYLQINGFPQHVSEGLTVFSVIKSDPGHDPQGRLISIGNGERETDNVRQGGERGWRVFGVKRAYSDSITAIGSGRRFAGHSHYMTADVAELLVFANLQSNSTGVGMDRIRKYLERKYAIGNTARGVVETNRLQGPTRFYLGGHLIESVTILDDQTATFISPSLPPSGNHGDLAPSDLSTLPMGPVSLALTAERDGETARAGQLFTYFLPAYDQWARNNLPPERRGSLEDSDRDGSVNLLEFATSSNALEPTVGPLFSISSPEAAAPYMEFNRNTNATDVLLSVEYSSDLRDWTTVPEHSPNLSVIPPVPLNDSSSLRVRYYPSTRSPEIFYRLRATKIPIADPPLRDAN